MKILHLDENHPVLIQELEQYGFTNHTDYHSSKKHIASIIHLYDGIIIRSRFPIDASFLQKATKLKFIGRVGAGLENIDIEYAKHHNIHLFAAPEGNRNAVGEHTLGMLLSLFNKLNKADREVKQGIWLREENRGIELDGHTIGIIGYGNMGKSFAKKLRGFEVEVICYDINPTVGDQQCRQVSLEELQEKSTVVSLHTPQTETTINMINQDFINKFKNPFWLLNTARGSAVVIEDLVNSLQKGLVLGAGLDVLSYEKSSFEGLFSDKQLPDEFAYLVKADNVILSPHVAGWTLESKKRLATTIVQKIKENFKVY